MKGSTALRFLGVVVVEVGSLESFNAVNTVCSECPFVLLLLVGHLQKSFL